MRHLSTLVLMFVLLRLVSVAHAAKPLPTVPQVDLNRYVGKWYEIAALPKFFQKGCTKSTATYSLREDGDIKVVNQCIRDGDVSGVEGKAWVVDKKTNAKLKVQIVWPFKGDYWIIALADDYSYAMVGTPDRESLWILSRTPELDPAVYDRLIAQAKEQGFPVDQVKKTEQ